MFIQFGNRRLRSALLASGLAIVIPQGNASHGGFPITQGIYRIPYLDGVALTVTADHHDHGGPNGNKDRIDMAGDAAGELVVAAAGGWIRGIVDWHGDDNGLGDGMDNNGNPQNDALEHSCVDAQDMNGNSIPNSVVSGLCQDYNNYVWVEHPNGEWSKYSHLATGSVSANGWQVDDWINAGEVLGPESDVGRATGPHLHFEVAIPNDPSDPTPFSANGGFIQGVNVVPFVCDIPTNLYATGDNLVANPCINQTPFADAGGPYLVDEGSVIQLDGSGSSDPDGTPLVYLWEPGDMLDNPFLITPTFSALDDVADLLFSLTVFDQVEAVPSMAFTTLTVLNVAPAVTASGAIVDEAVVATVVATMFDPGIADTHSASIDWDDGNGPQAVSIAALAAGVDHVYGDNGDYIVTVEVIDDDGGIGSDTAIVAVANLAPTLELDAGEVISFPGGDYVLVHAGGTLPLAAEGEDPGSDDLTFSWSTGVSNTYYNDGVGPDAAKSPDGVFPFMAEDSGEFVADAPGVVELSLTLSDDDGAETDAGGTILVLGTATGTEGSGWWKHQYSGMGASHISPALANAYREIVIAVSSVFSEAVAADSNMVVHALLSPSGGDLRARVRAELLLAWLSFASGAVAHDSVVSLAGGGIVGFLDLMFTAEAILLNPASGRAELQELERNLQRVRFAQ